MKAQHLPTWTVFELTGSCYFRKVNEETGNEDLMIAVSYLDWEETKTNEFPVNEETGEIIHDDYILIP